MAKVDRDGNISRWRVWLETEKKDLALQLHRQEIAAKQELIHQQQLFLGILVLCFLLLILLSYFLYRNLKKQESLSQKNTVLIIFFKKSRLGKDPSKISWGKPFKFEASGAKANLGEPSANPSLKAWGYSRHRQYPHPKQVSGNTYLDDGDTGR